jgi:hypothetical protein
MRLLSFLFVLVFSSIFADVDLENYRLYVTRVDPEFHCFELSNNLILNTVEWEWEKLPDEGTEIYLKPTVRSSQSQEERIRDGEFYTFYYQDDREVNVNAVWISTQLECTQPAGWFFSAVYENVIELSDGSKWICKNVPKFDKGDHVVLSADFWDSNKWFMYNVDKDFYFATDKFSVARNDGMRVQPYTLKEAATK